MKRLSLLQSIGLLLFTAGCSSLPNESAPVKSWIGKNAYFTRPVEISEKSDGEFFSKEDFKSCSKSEIISITTSEQDSNTAKFDIVVRQKDRKFLINKINRSEIIGYKRESYSPRSLKKHFKTKLPTSNKKIFAKEIKKNISTKKLLCNGLIWTDMTKAQFLFIKGRPNRISLPSSARDSLEDWFYNYSEDPAENKRYRFRKGKLKYWKSLNPKNIEK